jgi:hypothetical protein
MAAYQWQMDFVAMSICQREEQQGFDPASTVACVRELKASMQRSSSGEIVEEFYSLTPARYVKLVRFSLSLYCCNSRCFVA